MPRASITLTDLGDGHLRFPYSADLVADLKSHIPTHARAWTPEAKYWWIEATYVDLAARLARRYFPDLDYRDSPDRHRDARRPPPPPPRPTPPADPFAILHLLPTAPLELVEAAGRTLAKMCHPDVQPPEQRLIATHQMQQINEALDRVRRLRGVA